MTILLYYYNTKLLNYYITILLYYYIPGCGARVFLIILAAAPKGSRPLEPTASLPKFGLRRLGAEALRSARVASGQRCGSLASRVYSFSPI